MCEGSGREEAMMMFQWMSMSMSDLSRVMTRCFFPDDVSHHQCFLYSSAVQTSATTRAHFSPGNSDRIAVPEELQIAQCHLT
jgi:hypothetical protein